MRRRVALLPVLLLLATLAACAHPALTWTNPTHPSAELARDKYDCELSTRQMIQAKYGDNPMAQGFYHDKTFNACMASRGWRATKQ